MFRVSFMNGGILLLIKSIIIDVSETYTRIEPKINELFSQ